jgi:hypothetical protein
MSHHLDAPLARQNGRLYIDDLCVFSGDGGTVLVIDVNSTITEPHVRPSFHSEAHDEFKLHFEGATSKRSPTASRSVSPSEDYAAAGTYIGDQIAAVVSALRTSNDPEGYGQAVSRMLVPRRAAVRRRNAGELRARRVQRTYARRQRAQGDAVARPQHRGELRPARVDGQGAAQRALPVRRASAPVGQGG